MLINWGNLLGLIVARFRDTAPRLVSRQQHSASDIRLTEHQAYRLPYKL